MGFELCVKGAGAVCGNTTVGRGRDPISMGGGERKTVEGRGGDEDGGSGRE